MEINEGLLARRSVRKFTSEPVSECDVDALMHAAMSGPSACNCTPWEFYAVSNPDVLEKLRGAAHYSKIDAPLAIVVAGNLSRALPGDLAPFWVQDCSAATENILLRAVDLGLGCVWCGIHPQKQAEEKVSAALNLPKNQVPLNIIYVGHPAQTPPAGDQYKAEFVHYLR